MRIIIIIITFLLLVVGVFWFVLSAKIDDITKIKPYSSMLNVSLLANRELVLAKNLPEFKIKEENLITEDTILFEGVKKIALLPTNTDIKFLKAFEHTGGTTGITTIVLVGEVTVDNKVYKMEYLIHPEIIDFNIKKDSKEFAQINVDYFNKIFQLNK